MAQVTRINRYVIEIDETEMQTLLDVLVYAFNHDFSRESSLKLHDELYQITHRDE